ncbi:MAG: EamA family transporter [Nitrospirae bacterium]|jgi:drug/metabolite transporter (DMT)-like permease|nr:EamA family transporter [Nitrospirota bacterium]
MKHSIYILIAIFLWSSLGVFVRISSVEIHVLIFYALIVSLLIQSVIVFHPKFRHNLPPLRKLKYPFFFSIGSLINTFTFFYAFKNTTIANAVLTHYTAPIFVALLAPFILKEMVTKKLIAVIILATAGLWIMLDGLSININQSSGIIAGIISGFAYAFILIYVRKYGRNFHPLILAFFTNFFIVLMLLPFIHEFPSKSLWIYFFMGVVHSTIAPILYYKGLQNVTANKAAVLGYLEPVCAIIFSLIFLNEIPGLNSIFGGVLIIISGYITLRENSN